MRARHRNGFTLIEVLIAMTLLSVMVVLLFSSLKVAAESWNRGENKITEVNKKAVVYQFFKRHLTAIRPLPALDEQNYEAGLQQVFQGFSQSLKFAGVLPASSARKGVQVFDLALDPAETSILRVKLSPYRLVEGESKVEEPVVLLEHIKQLQFSYFGKTEEADELRWRDEWTIADRLPSLIKVSISLEDGSYWPDMVFPVKITQTHSAEAFADDIQDVQEER